MAPGTVPPVSPLAAELEALASELDDEELSLDPVCAVACARLVSDPTSTLVNISLTSQELRSRVARIRSGFTPRSAGA